MSGNKISNYSLAVQRLYDAAAIYSSSPEDTMYQDALIQRFEFTFELAWKSLREYLEDQGIPLSIISPRQVLKEAFAAKIITDEKTWNDMLQARNLTSHIYDEEAAKKIANNITENYLPALLKLKQFYVG